MSDFMIRFLICNILFCGIISILLLMKHILKNCLSSRMQYNLWFLLLGLLTVPFLPSHFFKFSELFFGFTNLKFLPSAATKNASAPPLHTNIAGAKDWMDDFALSVNEASSSAIGYLLLHTFLHTPVLEYDPCTPPEVLPVSSRHFPLLPTFLPHILQKLPQLFL